MPAPEFDPARPIKIAPSILAADFTRLGQEIKDVEAGGDDWIHVDVMDGHFVPNITFGPSVCAAIRPLIRGMMDVHLMIAPADPYLQAFAEAGADLITVHAEAGPHLDRSLQVIKGLGCKAGVAINPATPVEAVDYVLDQIDLICVMTVNPGFGGQSFLTSQIAKISKLREKIGDRPIHIQTDGGIALSTARTAAEAGADILVAGSAIYSGRDAEDYAKRIKALRDAANGS